MIIAQFVFAWLAIWSLSWIIADSKISLPARLWLAQSEFNIHLRGWPLTLAECPACLSFWIGLAVALIFFHLEWLAIPFALVSCGISLVLFLEVQRLSRE